MKQWTIFSVIILVVFLGCENNTAVNKTDGLKDRSVQKVQTQTTSLEATEVKTDIAKLDEKTFKPFYIYQDKGSIQNHYVPSGFMPSGKCVTLDDRWTELCYAGSSCIKTVYDVECSREGEKWAGIYWLNPANNWGKKKGGFDLTGAQKFTFWAKGELGGEQINEVTIGGITGDYPDSDKIVFGPIILMPVWRQYTIDLRGKDLSFISGGFSWSTSEEVNAEKCVFYLDEMRFE